MTEEFLEIILEDHFTREDHPYQEREHNYVFEITTWDPDTGEIIMDHEYRTLATDDFLSDEDALAEFQDYYGEQYGEIA